MKIDRYQVLRWSTMYLFLNIIIHTARSQKTDLFHTRHKRGWLENLLGGALTDLNNGNSSKTDADTTATLSVTPPSRNSTILLNTSYAEPTQTASIGNSINLDGILGNFVQGLIQTTKGSEVQLSSVTPTTSSPLTTGQYLDLSLIIGNLLPGLKNKPEPGQQTTPAAQDVTASSFVQSTTPAAVSQTPTLKLNIDSILGNLVKDLQDSKTTGVQREVTTSSTAEQQPTEIPPVFNLDLDKFLKDLNNKINVNPISAEISSIATTASSTLSVFSNNISISTPKGSALQDSSGSKITTNSSGNSNNTSIETSTTVLLPNDILQGNNILDILDKLKNDTRAELEQSSVLPETTENGRTTTLKDIVEEPVINGNDILNILNQLKNQTQTILDNSSALPETTENSQTTTAKNTVEGTVINGNDILSILGKLNNSSIILNETTTDVLNTIVFDKSPQPTTPLNILPGNLLDDILGKILSKEETTLSSTEPSEPVSTRRPSTPVTTSVSPIVNENYFKDILNNIIKQTYENSSQSAPIVSTGGFSGETITSPAPTIETLLGQDDLKGILGQILNDIGKNDTEIIFTESVGLSTTSSSPSSILSSTLQSEPVTSPGLGQDRLDEILGNLFNKPTTTTTLDSTPSTSQLETRGFSSTSPSSVTTARGDTDVPTTILTSSSVTHSSTTTGTLRTTSTSNEDLKTTFAVQSPTAPVFSTSAAVSPSSPSASSDPASTTATNQFTTVEDMSAFTSTHNAQENTPTSTKKIIESGSTTELMASDPTRNSRTPTTPRTKESSTASKTTLSRPLDRSSTSTSLPEVNDNTVADSSKSGAAHFLLFPGLLILSLASKVISS